MPQANNAVIVASRVNQVYKLLLGGASRRDILDHAEKQEWDVSPRAVDNYIKRAKTALAKESEFWRAYEFGKSLEQWDMFIARALRYQDIRTAAFCLKERCHMLSLYLPPAPRTLQILDMSESMAQEVAATLQAHGLNAGDVFNAMLAELAKNDNAG